MNGDLREGLSDLELPSVRKISHATHGLALRLGVFLPTLGCRSPFTLPLGRLPSPQLAQTVGFTEFPALRLAAQPQLHATHEDRRRNT